MSSLLRNSTLERVFRPFPKKSSWKKRIGGEGGGGNSEPRIDEHLRRPQFWAARYQESQNSRKSTVQEINGLQSWISPPPLIVSFGAGYPADVHADILADVRGQKLRSGPRNPGKISISVRTSLTRRRGRPRPKGVKKNFGQKNFGLNFRSLFLNPINFLNIELWVFCCLPSVVVLLFVGSKSRLL